MRITSSKKDDILRRKAEYDAKYEEYNTDRLDREGKYYAELDRVLAPIRNELESNLNKFDALSFDVKVDTDYHFDGRNQTIRVEISCDENRKFDDQVALAWSYKAYVVKSGEVARETSSWSGMSAVTADQMKSLKQTVAALDYLNNIDWNAMLDAVLPEHASFFEGAIKRPEREDFEAELRQAEIEELIGQDKIIQVQNFESSGYSAKSIYVKLLRETPSQYEVIVIPAYTVMRMTPEELSEHLKTHGYAQRVKKSNIVPVIPLDIKEV